MKRIFLSGLLALGMFPVAVHAVDTTYLNAGTLISPPDALPVVNATNFVNTGLFTVNLPGAGQYKTTGTLNYTNTGTMSAQYGFDLETFPGNKMAANFFNPGSIDCNFNGGFGGLAGIQMIVSATNISNPGTISMGQDSQLKLTGQSVDLSRSVLAMVGVNTFVNGTLGVTSLDYGVGQCPVTNGLTWDPSANLTAFFASSAIFTNYAGVRNSVNLFNSTGYYVTNQPNANNVIIRAVFLENMVPQVNTRVFIESSDVGGGYAHIEWAGPYMDPASGTQHTNYFYLSDVFVRTTNSFINNGIPSGFTFAQNNDAPIFYGAPTPSGIPADLFIPGDVTNLYSYVSVQVSPTTASTNALIGGSVTNLLGRVLISASRDLDLSLAQISTPNFLSLSATNQYNGNEGASISAPYGDIRLGVTNGFLTISNLWRPTLPLWSGTIEAWNTRWFGVITNDLGTNGTVTITNDYRVLLVSSALIPTAPASVWDLVLHSTNSLIISDLFNVIHSLSIDAERLTVTTNGYGVGATSAQGELNLGFPNFSWATSVPRLRWLTNNGAIRMLTQGAPLQNFGSSGTNYFAFINNGLFAIAGGTTIWADNFQNNGSISNSQGSFTLHASSATMTNGTIIAGDDISIIAGSVSSSKQALQAGRSLTLTVTNLLTDNGVVNGNTWAVGSANGTAGSGFTLTIKPTLGDLLGTTISSIAPGPNKQIVNTWAGEDRQASTAGYTNNAAVGRLILDALGVNSQFVLNGAGGVGVTNAIYVDRLELRDYATNRDAGGNFPWLNINSNLVIYYAQAVISGASIAEKMNHKNNDRLRWVAAYAGNFSSTNLVKGGVTNKVNAALAQSTIIDSNGNGIPNASDPTPFFLPSQIKLTVTLTNQPPLTAVLKWFTIPNATNYVEYRTNLLSLNWLPLTNFVSPVPYPSPATNVTVFDPVNFASPRFYRVTVSPWLTFPD